MLSVSSMYFFFSSSFPSPKDCNIASANACNPLCAANASGVNPVDSIWKFTDAPFYFLFSPNFSLIRFSFTAI